MDDFLLKTWYFEWRWNTTVGCGGCRQAPLHYLMQLQGERGEKMEIVKNNDLSPNYILYYILCVL